MELVGLDLAHGLRKQVEGRRKPLRFSSLPAQRSFTPGLAYFVCMLRILIHRGCWSRSGVRVSLAAAAMPLEFSPRRRQLAGQPRRSVAIIYIFSK